MSPENIARIEQAVQQAFHGLVRKNGDLMSEHSLEVGRLVSVHPMSSDEAIFAGYCHDMPEDTAVTQEELYLLAMEVFGNPVQAQDAVALTLECCYTDLEYELPKKERKAAACERWGNHEDIRVALVKACDIDSNAASAPLVSPEFEREYLSWAGPLRERLKERLSEVQVSFRS